MEMQVDSPSGVTELLTVFIFSLIIQYLSIYLTSQRKSDTEQELLFLSIEPVKSSPVPPPPSQFPLSLFPFRFLLFFFSLLFLLFSLQIGIRTYPTLHSVSIVSALPVLHGPM